MLLYFVKATYTNNVYKLSDFFLNGAYKLDANKLLNINSRIPNTGESRFITKNLELPDGSDTREHTHIIVPEYDKIYKIVGYDYINAQQYQFNLEEDALIGNYLDLESENIIMNRVNDTSFFRGINDISDTTLKETVTTKVIQSTARTGKWALLFMQVDASKARLGLKFKNYNANYGYEEFADRNAIVTAYPEVTTEEPSKYDYFQKKAFSVGDLTAYECVYTEVGGIGQLYWAKYNEFIGANTDFYFDIDDAVGIRLIESDIRNAIIALPFETSILGDHATNDPYLLSWNRFVGPIDSGELIDVKIVDDIFLPFTDCTWTNNTTLKTVDKELDFDGTNCNYVPLYDAASGGTEYTDFQGLAILSAPIEIELNPSYIGVSILPTDAEPFNKYELYVLGQRFSIPYYLTDDLTMLVALNSGVINYTIYYNNKRNILASGSFTSSAKYQIDQLDSFYNQNPTYKDQFYLKMGGNAFKTVAGGAFAGGMAGPLGVAGGATLGAVTAAVDGGLSIMNYKLMEKGLMLKPDQIFGDISETALTLINLFGIYFVKRVSENADRMRLEYDLNGFPTTILESIDDLNYATSVLFNATSKIVFGELKNVIRNEYTTDFINNKLKEGIILIP